MYARTAVLSQTDSRRRLLRLFTPRMFSSRRFGASCSVPARLKFNPRSRVSPYTPRPDADHPMVVRSAPPPQEREHAGKTCGGGFHRKKKKKLVPLTPLFIKNPQGVPADTGGRASWFLYGLGSATTGNAARRTRTVTFCAARFGHRGSFDTYGCPQVWQRRSFETAGASPGPPRKGASGADAGRAGSRARDGPGRGSWIVAAHRAQLE